MRSLRLLCTVLAIIGVGLPNCALAWGDTGHRIIAHIAYGRLTPVARAEADRLLAADTEPLAGSDEPSEPPFIAAATWADRLRELDGPSETSEWHHVGLKIGATKQDWELPCFGWPKLAEGTLASSGPADACVVDKIYQFADELWQPDTPEAERIIALKFLIHLVGDIHQPLHAADNNDLGGNCVFVRFDGGISGTRLHAYWDNLVVRDLGESYASIGDRLAADVTAEQAQTWNANLQGWLGGSGQGWANDWASESFEVAFRSVYQPLRSDWDNLPTCDKPRELELGLDYQDQAKAAVQLQLIRGGVRLADLLNALLDRQPSERG
ncbi:MAG: Nuclease [Caulobacter sp.]|nr:Nuclease [Caulobacter sp.]